MISFRSEDECAAPLRRLIPWLDLCLRHAATVPEGTDLVPVADGIGVKRVEYETHAVSRCRFETHRDHVDVQVGISGGERIHLAPRATLEVATPWNEAEDVVFYQPPSADPETVSLAPGRFLVFFPDDSHRCGTHDGTHDRILKLVFKVHRRLWQA
jgi:YhcH/YjgK/YiaL family protein